MAISASPKDLPIEWLALVNAIETHRKEHQQSPIYILVSKGILNAVTKERAAYAGYKGLTLMWDPRLDLCKDEDGNTIERVITIAAGRDAPKDSEA